MMNIFAKLDSSIETVNNLFSYLKVKVSCSAVQNVLEEHPDFPSFLSISDTLNEFGVDNISVSTTYEKLKEFTPPFITYHSNNRSDIFMLTLSVNESEITVCVNKYGKKQTISKDRFLENWSGKSMLIDVREDAGDQNYSFDRKNERFQSFVIFALYTLVVALWLLPGIYLGAMGQWLGGLIYSTKIIGALVCAILLWYEIDNHNPFLQKVCSSVANSDCNAILRSKASRLFGLVSWSEIGFAYFTGGTMALLIGGSLELMLECLAWVSVFALPYTIFSVWYQWHIARQWCVLCLSIQFVLLAETVIFILANKVLGKTFLNDNSILAFAVIICCMFSVLVIWLVLKKKFRASQELKHTRLALTRIKYNLQTFDSMLERQPMVEFSTEGLGISIGNPNAKNRIIKVCNPYCSPCAMAHIAIENLLKVTDDIFIQVIFTAQPSVADKKYFPVRHLLAIADKKNDMLTHKAMDDWYRAPVKDYLSFANKYSNGFELDGHDGKIEQMKEWCQKMNIFSTPTFFINEHRMPDIYKIEDIKYFLTL